MSSYFNVIGTAFFVFPVLAFAFTVPYLLFQYKKFGAIPLLRSAIIYSFILYCLTAYFLVILPLPSRAAVAQMTTPRYNLVPASGLIAYWRANHLSFREIDSYLKLFTSPSMREILFNVCMLFPLGVYLRYYFKCKMGKTVLFGFLMSLFFELTQLSALYGIYPRPYRLFDVTDLLDNTFGAWLGYLCTPIFCFFLPSREELDRRAYQKGQKVPFFRRVFAAVIDWLALIIFYVAVESVGTEIFPILRKMQWLKPIIMAFSVLVYFGFFQWLCKGYTAGKAFFALAFGRSPWRTPKVVGLHHQICAFIWPGAAGALLRYVFFGCFFFFGWFGIGICRNSVSISFICSGRVCVRRRNRSKTAWQ